MKLYVDIKKQYKSGFKLHAEFELNGGVLGLLGASGSGKTVTLRCIAGLIKPDSGVIMLNDNVLFDAKKRIHVPANRRNIGFLFQNYALFPHMTVRKNLLMANKKADVERLLARMDLAGFAERYPLQLSGGQQQRVALARCLAQEPDILLLDEPFSALDENLRERMRMDMRQTLTTFDGSAVLVTHSESEAKELCGRIIRMDNGLTHFDAGGKAQMVDVGGKEATERCAVAHGRIQMNARAYAAVKEGTAAKGDVLGAARIAGIMALKRTADIVPLCHPILIDRADIAFAFDDEKSMITTICTVEVFGKTGVEMEAILGASAALITIFDMCKAVDKGMTISDIRLLKKSGGKSGVYCNDG